LDDYAMAAGEKPGKTKVEFVVRYAPYARILHKLEQGRASEVDPSALAAEIREHGFVQMPGQVQSFLYDVLEGKVEMRGRKGKTRAENRLEGLRAQSFYESLREVQKGADNVFPAAVELYKSLCDDIEEAYSPSEFVWRMVAVLMRGSQGHHKAIKNLAGKAQSASGNTAQK
jgi:hypothetical protein